MRIGTRVGTILLLGLVLWPGSLHPQQTVVQTGSTARERGFRLEQNYPNPFNPSTRIPFVLGDGLFVQGDPVVISIRIYNVLQQLVAIPTALNHPQGNSVRVDRLVYQSAGRHEAYWDGLDMQGRTVASGVYYLQLVVNGEAQVRKMLVTK